MVKQLTAKAKQEIRDTKQDIRDKIAGLHHLREPYILVIQLSFPVFIAILLFMAGRIYLQMDNMADVSYNLTFISNLSSNTSTSSNYGVIQPVKNLNPYKIKSLFDNLFIITFFVYLIALVIFFYTFVYVKYDNKIKLLYNQLTGIDNNSNKIQMKNSKKYLSLHWYLILMTLAEFFIILDAGFVGYSMEHGIAYALDKVIFWVLLLLGVGFRYIAERYKNKEDKV